MPLVIGDHDAAQKLLEELQFKTRLYDGSQVYRTHGLESTPVLVAIDAKGIVRHIARGWTKETAATVMSEFERLSK